MEGCTLGIYVPSYRRSSKILTYHLLEYCTYMVRKSEEQAYREAGVENIWAVDDELIDGGDNDDEALVSSYIKKIRYI